MTSVEETQRIICDYETASRADIKSVGSYRYSEDPSTRVLCFAYRVRLCPTSPLFFEYDTGGLPVIWRPGDPTPKWIADKLWEKDPSILIEAHNRLFEAAIWKNISQVRHGWAYPEDKHWTCTAARASMCALPRALGDVGAALNLPVQKSKEGHAVMLSVCRPRGVKKPVDTPFTPGEPEFITKARNAYEDWHKEALKNEFPGEFELDPDGSIYKWYTPESEAHRAARHEVSMAKRLKAIEKQREKLAALDEEEFYNLLETEGIRLLQPMAPEPNRFDILYEYVSEDVRAEESLSLAIDELPSAEREVWLFDQLCNLRGIYLDISSVKKALKIIADYEEILNKEVLEITGGFCESTGQIAKVVQFLQSRGVPIPNLQAETVDNFLEKSEGMSASCRRLLEIRQGLSKASTKKLLGMVNRASADNRARDNLMFWGASTGRWAARGLQLQNLPRVNIKGFNQEEAFELLQQEDWKVLKDKYGCPMNAISNMIRGFVCAAPGKRFIDADFSNIEGRILAWLANEEWKLQAFRDFDKGVGPDLYRLSYAKAFDLPISQVTDEQRQIGKVLELSMGFGGGVGAFQNMAKNYGVVVSDDRADELKTLWRERHPATKKLWKDLEQAALEAVITKEEIKCGKVSFFTKDKFLCCRLPSGRLLYYYDPITEVIMTPWGQEKRQITFRGVNAVTKQFERESIWGGTWAENLCQSCARDILAAGLLRVEKKGYPVVIHIHDESLSEVPEDYGSVTEYCKLLCTPLPWAEGLPVVAEGWSGKRYCA